MGASTRLTSSRSLADAGRRPQSGSRPATRRRTGPQARRVRQDRRDPRQNAHRDRALHVLAHVVRALQLQALAQAAQAVPHRGAGVMQGPGENAGVISVGDGWAVAFKMESHNHPSAIEPYQGAATGVGGIIRDIFTMGARPIASLDSLRFGTLDIPSAALPVRGLGRRHRRLRQLSGRAHHRRRGLLRGGLRGQLPHQRDVDRPHARGEPDPRRRGGPGQPRAADRLDHRPRRHRRRERAREPGVRRACRGQAPGRSGGRPVRGEAAHRGVPRTAGEGAARWPRRLRRCRDDELHQRDGEPRRRGGRHRRRCGTAARGRHEAVRDHGLRVAGAHGRRRRAREARRRRWASARSGGCARP